MCFYFWFYFYIFVLFFSPEIQLNFSYLSLISNAYAHILEFLNGIQMSFVLRYPFSTHHRWYKWILDVVNIWFKFLFSHFDGFLFLYYFFSPDHCRHQACNFIPCYNRSFINSIRKFFFPFNFLFMSRFSVMRQEIHTKKTNNIRFVKLLRVSSF